jgi:PKD repeat protein
MPGIMGTVLILAITFLLVSSFSPVVTSAPARDTTLSNPASSVLKDSPGRLHVTSTLPYPFHGVDRSGTEYACIVGWGYGVGPYNLTGVQEMRAWNVTAVRIPLNEDCWLGINVAGTAAANYSGAGYRAFIVSYVDLLESQGIRPILCLFAVAPGTSVSNVLGQPMVDEDHGPAFWASLASTFRNDSLVIFDLFNEPHDISWSCWLNGCVQTYTNPSWQTAGMQQLVDVVRAAGATTQLLMLGGLDWANDLSEWMSNEPTDPAGPGLLAASLHAYNWKTCASSVCWDLFYSPIIKAGIPFVTGELGENDCNTSYSFIDSYFSWAEPLGVPYLGWSWNPAPPSTCPVLISNYTGTPYLAYGVEFRKHLLGFPAPSLVTPSVPQAVVARPENSSVLVSWSPPASAGTWPVDSYTIAWGTSSGSLTSNFTTSTASVTSYRVQGLTNDQTYYFSVSAVNPIGSGPRSTPIAAIPVADLASSAAASPLSGLAPLTVSFTGKASGGELPLTYLWIFGDGGHTSTAQDPSHTYNTTGSFSVSFAVADSRGNTSTSHLNVTVTSIPQLTATIQAAPTSGSFPLTVSFSSTVSGGTPAYSYAWNFGDGSPGSSAPAPAHLYNSSGTFEVEFSARDSGALTVVRYTNITASNAVVTLDSIAVSPPSSVVQSGSYVPFSAVPSCTPGACPSGLSYSWSLTSSLGTLSAYTGQNVDFIAGTSAGTVGLFVNATLGAATVEGSAIITVSTSTTSTLSSISVSPSSTTMAPGSVQDFAATPACTSKCPVSGISYTWALTSSTIGSINVPTGVAINFTAGSTAGSAGLFVNATLNGTTQGTHALITVTSSAITLASLSMSPTTPTLSPAGTRTFTATPSCKGGACPSSGISYQWALSAGSLGSLAGTGASVKFTAGSTAGTVGIFVNASLGGISAGSSTVITITGATEPVLSGVSIDPPSLGLLGGEGQTFSASPECTGGACSSSVTYIWSLSNSLGSLSTNSGTSTTFTAADSSGTVDLNVSATLNGISVRASAVISITSAGSGTGGGGGGSLSGASMWFFIIAIAAAVIATAVAILLRRGGKGPEPSPLPPWGLPQEAGVTIPAPQWQDSQNEGTRCSLYPSERYT